ncbi:MAG: nodulation protein NfeD [Syntrophorhabdaceae bacterium]|nr:nodulation protein NfeD [Syntrophorhabdaceae bacterium]MDD5244792.1 nodulation protein NfeD [Syntrophorhabdaceae bacterium]
MKKLCPLILIGFLFILSVFVSNLFAKDLCTIRINGIIGPPVAGFIKESIEKCSGKGSEALLILLDTPGGLDTSMRDIIKNIMDSSVPVIVYVYPSGARAASAGAIILLSSHIAAMAPGTNVGAAHPVTIGKEKVEEEVAKKAVNDAEAYARSIAMKRGRNVEWAAKAVKESSSITAKDALEKHVIDVMADNIDELLAKIDGKTVDVRGKQVALRTKGAVRVDIEMPLKYRLLSYLSDPNVAYILMMMGIYGILFEIYSPGTIFPGVIGGISIILALYAFQTIPISFAGLALIFLGVIFFVLELKIISHGLLGIAGVISIVIGSIMLIDLPYSVLSISWKTILVVAIVSAAFIFGVLSYAVKAQLSKVKTGMEGLVGETGVARTDIANKGKVSLHGEIWQARSDERIEKGEEVIVTGVEKLVVKVQKKGG